MKTLIAISLFCFLQTCFAAHFPVEFRLFTKANPTTYQVVTTGLTPSLLNSNFDKFKDTKFITHGYTESATTSVWMAKMRDELLAYGDYNIFLVDWTEGADAIRYDVSADNAELTGEEIYWFVDFLKSSVGYSESRVHLIGFSLGAQASGAAGKRMPTIARISGLDPAGPGFDNYGLEKKLDSTDAQFVDIIHVDGNTVGGAGCWYPSGHVDFYPNGGKAQPACSVAKRDVGATGDLGCDHTMAPEYYIESINIGCSYESCPCALGEICTGCTSGFNYMGFHANNSPTGVFYLDTNALSPYCQK